MNKTAQAFLKVAEKFEQLAECEPDFNQAQYYRSMAKGMKHEAAALANVKETDNGDATKL